MGGSSKKQTVGYKYFFGVHMGIGRGPVDALHEIRVADKQAWRGRITKNQSFQIQARELFGGESKEGGVEGRVEVMMGESDQEASTGLKAMLGSVLPGFRGMFTVFYNGLVSVNNPYPKAWKFRLNRVLKGWDGAPWYPEKAKIKLTPTSGKPIAWLTDKRDPRNPELLYEYRANGSSVWRSTLDEVLEDVAYGSTYHRNATSVVVGWSRGTAKMYPASSPPSPTDADTVYLHLNRAEAKKGYYGTLPPDMGGYLYCTPFQNADIQPSNVHFWWSGLSDFDEADTTSGTPGLYRLSYSEADEGEVVLNNCVNYPSEDGLFPKAMLTHDIRIEVRYLEGAGDPFAMNPAHIIYECLTNRVWGRGLEASKLDDGSFRAAAETLHAEDFGLCLKWTRKDSIENFIQGVIDHIGATLYVSRTTKLYTLKLIRGGYNLNDLPLFDTESGILSISDASVASIGSTVNAVQVKYHDWENDEERTVSVKNAAAIVAAGGAVNQVTRDFPGIPVASLALRVAQRELRAVSTALRKFTITMDRRGEDFAPGDVLAIQDPKRGVPKMVVRVGRVEDGTLLDGKITLTVVQDVFTLPATTMAADVPSTWVPPNNTPCIDQQRVFEAPYFLMVRTMSKADLDYVGPDSGYIATLNSRGQPLNQGYKIAVRPDAPTVDDNPADDSYACGV